MTDEPYTNMDLETADQILISAGHGEIARALKYQTHGNRNLIQGEWGMKVVSAFEQILQVQVVAALATVQKTLDRQHDIVQQILATTKASDRTAKEALSVARAGAARLGKFQKDLDGLHAGQKRISGEVKELRDKIEADELRLDSKRERIERLEFEVSELKAWVTGLPTPDESRRLIALLEHLAAERGGSDAG